MGDPEVSGDGGGAEQLTLAVPGARTVRRPRPEGVAEVDPVALVLVDSGLPHLDRPFEYAVPTSMADDAVPGARVKVRFAGRDLDGFVLERTSEAEHDGRLAPLRRVVSPEPVLGPETLALCREVAARWAGSVADVVRLAVPPRHAAAEKALPVEAPEDAGSDGPAQRRTTAWERYAGGPAMLTRLAAGDDPWASWLALPATTPDLDWPTALAQAAAAALAGDRGSVLVVPDARDVARVEAALAAEVGAASYVRLTADQGPQARYTAWLKVLRGHVRVVVGTRAAAFAPVRDLGLVAWWDDGDDLHAEPRAPYPHVGDVLATRARLEGAALVSAGFARTARVEQDLRGGTLRSVAAGPREVRRAAPRVVVAGEGLERDRDVAAASAHLPSVAHRTAREALEKGPVLVQVPRRGYLPSLACQTCRTPARCPHCHGPLALASQSATPSCRWCGRTPPQDRFTCANCGGHRLRSSVVGARRTAEELGRAFPGSTVVTSGAGEVHATVTGRPLVIATPGAEPVAEGGYAAVLLLDAWALLDRATLDAGEEALRRWLGAAGLARGAADGGVVVLCGVPEHTTLPAVEALVRWDPAWFAARELDERASLSLPPAVRMARLTGPRPELQKVVASLSLPDGADVLGPLPAGEDAAVLLRAPLAEGPTLARTLTDLRAVRSARKEPVAVGIRLDPPDLGV